jgi:hypothetical protein
VDFTERKKKYCSAVASINYIKFKFVFIIVLVCPFNMFLFLFLLVVKSETTLKVYQLFLHFSCSQIMELPLVLTKQTSW